MSTKNDSPNVDEWTDLAVKPTTKSKPKPSVKLRKDDVSPNILNLSNYSNTRTLQHNIDNTELSKEASYDELFNYVLKFIKANDLDFTETSHDLNADFKLVKLSDAVYLSINDNLTHNCTITDLSKDFHYRTYRHYLDKNIRIINCYENHLKDSHKWNVLQDIILHALGKSKHKIFARKTDVVVSTSRQMRPFFIENNIQGARSAKTAFILVDKITREPLMSYTVGDAYFGKGLYDAEIARGACRLGYSVVGGASKLWRYIQDFYASRNLDNTKGCLNSIVYYVDLNYYNGSSMSFLDGVETLRTQLSFWNYWRETGEMRNRDPMNHKLIMENIRSGKILEIGNAGTQLNVWRRSSSEV